jgi:uncharacterized membrane protein YebE (DUF533 family)
MNLSSILEQLTGGSNNKDETKASSSATSSLKGITDKIPGGLTGGAVAGGLVALLLGSKSVRKTAGKAAKYGGVALLGGLAYKAYQNWQKNQSESSTNQTGSSDHYLEEAQQHMDGAETSNSFQLALIKAMIAAARADGQIDSDERAKISQAIEKMQIDSSEKSQLLELFLNPVSIDDFVGDLNSMEQRAEVYLASCLTIDLDHEAEYAHLSNLSKALELPSELEQELRHQAKQALAV